MFVEHIFYDMRYNIYKKNIKFKAKDYDFSNPFFAADVNFNICENI